LQLISKYHELKKSLERSELGIIEKSCKNSNATTHGLNKIILFGLYEK